MTGTKRDGPLLAARGLGKQYRIARGHAGILDAINNISIDLYEGRVLAVVGESGSGKSTLAKLLAGREVPTAGHLELEGSVVTLQHRHAYQEYKRVVQMIFQDPFASLNPVHTVAYHLERPVKLHQAKRGEELSDEVQDLLTQVKLTPAEQYLKKYPHELSGGQRQRVSIARALAAKPKVLLADEPVSMLDVSIRLEILALLDDARTRLALAVLYITHDIASARYLADEIVVMYAGKVVEQGTAEEVTQSPAHPYTQLLISSSPDPDLIGSHSDHRFKVPPARTADIRVSPGCPFVGRCPLANAQCRTSDPPSVELSHGHRATCWHLLGTGDKEIRESSSRSGKEVGTIGTESA